MKVTFEGSAEDWREVFGLGVGAPRPSEDWGFEGSGIEGPTDVKQEFDPPLEMVPDTSAEGEEDRGPKAVLQEVSPEARAAAWENTKDFCTRWVVGFDAPGVDQPPRQQMMADLGQGAHARTFLLFAYAEESLQVLIGKALAEAGAAPSTDDVEIESQWWDWVDRVASQMVQVSHTGFPDLGGTYDYSQRWKRRLA